jgi:hypothetical protein
MSKEIPPVIDEGSEEAQIAESASTAVMAASYATTASTMLV